MSKSTVKDKTLNVGTLNVQGCRDEFKQSINLEDALNYDLHIIGLTETHVIDEGTKTFIVKKNNTNRACELFVSGIKDHNTYTGTAIVIQSDFRPRFKRITDRISTASFQLNNKHEAHVIVTNAPTHARSKKEPQIREDFYNELEKVTSKHAKNKHLLLILGDFNAKTDSGHKLYPNNIGQYGKGHLSSNGENLLEYTKENNLVLTNTLFYHKLGHRTTWTSLECVNPHISVDGTVRGNSYRNQIGYIITKSIHRNLFLDSRSHGNLSTITDHKLVKAKINLEWWRLKRQFKKSEGLDVNRLRDPEMSQKYRKDLQTRLEVERKENERPDTTWKRIAKACKETARNTVGIKEFSKTQSSSLIVQKTIPETEETEN